MSHPRKKRPWLTCLTLIGCVAVLCLCCNALVAGLGYALYTNGSLNLNQVLSLVGMSPSEMQIINLSDGPIETRLERIEAESGESYNQGSLELDPYAIASFRSLSASEYRLQIEVPNGLPPSSSCRLQIKGGQVYRVVTVPEGIVIALDNHEVDAIEELDMAQSPFCQP